LQLRDDGGLDYTAVIGELPVSVHRVAYVFLRDSLNEYLAGAMSFLCQRYPEVPMTGSLHLQHHMKLICAITKPAVSMTAAQMDQNISIGMTAIWMVQLTPVDHPQPSSSFIAPTTVY